MTRPSVALDIGQSSTRIAVDGERVDQVLPGLRGAGPLDDQLLALVSQALALVGGAATVAVGTTGIESLTIASELRPQLPSTVRAVAVAHDSVTSYLGCLGARPGCVIAAGTGTVAMAVGSSVARVDGWGSLLGDAGSGYWIGRAAIEAVLREEDGRGPATALRAPIAERFDGLELIGMRLQADPDRVRRIAACAQDVAALATSDEVAAGITEAAGRELATTVRAGCDRAGLTTGPVAVVATGNALGSAPLTAAFERHLGELLPYGHLQPADGDGLDGAARLHSVSPDFAASGLISRG